MKHAYRNHSTLDEVASELDVCDILEISSREHKILGISIEPFSFCFTCNMSLIKAVMACVIADLLSYRPGPERSRAIPATHAVLSD